MFCGAEDVAIVAERLRSFLSKLPLLRSILLKSLRNFLISWALEQVGLYDEWAGGCGLIKLKPTL